MILAEIRRELTRPAFEPLTVEERLIRVESDTIEIKYALYAFAGFLFVMWLLRR